MPNRPALLRFPAATQEGETNGMGLTRLPLCHFPMFPAHERRTIQPAYPDRGSLGGDGVSPARFGTP